MIYGRMVYFLFLAHGNGMLVGQIRAQNDAGGHGPSRRAPSRLLEHQFCSNAARPVSLCSLPLEEK